MDFSDVNFRKIKTKIAIPLLIFFSGDRSPLSILKKSHQIALLQYFRSLRIDLTGAVILTAHFIHNVGLWAERSPPLQCGSHATTRTHGIINTCTCTLHLLNAFPFILILKTFDTEGGECKYFEEHPHVSFVGLGFRHAAFYTHTCR